MLKKSLRKLGRRLAGRTGFERIDEITAHMRLGFIDAGIDELRALATEHDRSSVREAAALEMLAWQLGSGDELSLGLVHSQLATWSGKAKVARLLLGEGYRRAGDFVAAREVQQGSAFDRDADILLGRANLCPDTKQKLDRLNAALATWGLSPVTLDEDRRSSTFDRLVATTSPCEHRAVAARPLVSVIVPVFNAAETLPTALRSLQMQSYGNFEILVVDDASCDATCDVVRGFAVRDARIQLVRASENRGCYSVRNRGLEAAAGTFVTCHDADDWSHPEKLARQVADLIENEGHVANLSQWVRADEDLLFELRPLSGSFLQTNFSSLMFRREEILKHAGYWDSVRYAGDAEFIKRLQLLFGKSRISVLPGILALGRRASGSLTRASNSAHFGVLSGSRLYYQMRFEEAHAHGKTRFDFPLAARPFDVPNSMRPLRTRGTADLDLIFVDDFRDTGARVVREIADAAAAGFSVGITHLPMRKGNHKKPFDGAISDLLDRQAVQYIPYGEAARAKWVVIRNAEELEDFNRYAPAIGAQSVLLVVEGASRASTEKRTKSEAIASRYFGKRPVWCGPGGSQSQPEPSEERSWLDIVRQSSD